MLVVSVIGDTPREVASAIGRLASCSLAHALQLPQQAALQPQGWLAAASGACAYQDGDTLWVGVAMCGSGGGAALSLEEVQEAEAQASRALLLAFLTSHAVLWLHPADRLARGGATALLRRLRLLQQLKSALLPGLPALLGVPAKQASAAQPGLCIPQLLLLAQAPAAAGQVAEARQQWQAGLDRQLRTLLKLCQVLQPSDSPRALCSLPPTGPLVLLLPERLGCSSQAQLVSDALAGLALPGGRAGAAPGTDCSGAPLPLVPGAGQAGSSRGGVPPQPAAAAAVAAALAPQRAALLGQAGSSSSSSSSAEGVVRSWRQAVASLGAVLEAAARRGKSSGSGGGAVGEAAADVAAADVAVPLEAASAVAWQQACSGSLRQFSLACCKRAAAVASDAYRRNTPALLPAAGHAVALQAALRLYRSLARGPAAADGAAALEDELDGYWRGGHMQCDAVSFLGNPCCLPAHDPSQQPHTSAPSGGTRPLLLLATGSGARQQSIPEPFTVAELQRAAAAVAADGASATARAQFLVRRQGAGAFLAGATSAGAGTTALPAAAAGAAQDAAAAAAAVAAAEEAAAEEEEAAGYVGGRYNLSGAAGHSSDEEAEAEAEAGGEPGAGADGGAEGGEMGEGGGTTVALAGAGSPRMALAGAAAAAAAAAATAAGLPAPGCWLELHLLGRRAEWKTGALAAALLLDGQPGWLRAGGCMFGVLPLVVAVPPRPGQQQQASQQQQELAVSEEEEFPSLQAVRQQARRQKEQRQRPAAAAKRQQAAAGVAGREAPPAQQPPRLLTWPGWPPAAEAAAAAVAAAGGGAGGWQRGQQFGRAGRQRAGRLAPQQAAGGRKAGPEQQQQQQRPGHQPGQQGQQGGAAEAANGAAAAAAAAAAAVAAGTAVVEPASLLLGFEYESVQGQRLLLTPALLATAQQSSLDAVSVRQHAPGGAAAGPGPGPGTAAAAAAAAAAAPAGPQAAASLLLLQDLPLWVQLPGDQLAAMAGKRRGGPGLHGPGAAGPGPGVGAPGPPAAAAGGGRPGQQPAVWLQLRRILVGTPDLAVPLQADPVLLLEVPREMLAPAGGGTAGSGGGTAGGGTAGSGGGAVGSGTVQLRYSLPAPLPIPPGSFCVLALPWLLTAPMLESGGGGGAGTAGSGSPAALIRCSGPLRAVLQGGTAVQPGLVQALPS